MRKLQKTFFLENWGELVIDSDFGVLRTSAPQAVIKISTLLRKSRHHSLSSPSPHRALWSGSAFMRLNLIMHGRLAWCVSPLIEAEKGDHPSGGGQQWVSYQLSKPKMEDRDWWRGRVALSPIRIPPVIGLRVKPATRPSPYRHPASSQQWLHGARPTWQLEHRWRAAWLCLWQLHLAEIIKSVFRACIIWPVYNIHHFLLEAFHKQHDKGV